MIVPDSIIAELLSTAGHVPRGSVTADVLRAYSAALVGRCESAVEAVAERYRPKPGQWMDADERRIAMTAASNCQGAIRAAFSEVGDAPGREG